MSWLVRTVYLTRKSSAANLGRLINLPTTLYYPMTTRKNQSAMMDAEIPTWKSLNSYKFNSIISLSFRIMDTGVVSLPRVTDSVEAPCGFLPFYTRAIFLRSGCSAYLLFLLIRIPDGEYGVIPPSTIL